MKVSMRVTWLVPLVDLVTPMLYIQTVTCIVIVVTPILEVIRMEKLCN